MLGNPGRATELTTGYCACSLLAADTAGGHAGGAVAADDDADDDQELT